MIKIKNEPYQLHFAELGDYDSLDYTFKTIEEAKKSQKEMIDRSQSSGYYTHISKIIEVRRKEPDEEEQTKVFK